MLGVAVLVPGTGVVVIVGVNVLWPLGNGVLLGIGVGVPVTGTGVFVLVLLGLTVGVLVGTGHGLTVMF